MGEHGHGGGARAGGELTVSVVRVIPDLPTFAVDDGFRYASEEALDIGTIVRVPLGRRRVRGWVVEVGSGDAEGLKKVIGRSADVPVFDRRLLEVLRWAAVHYVAPNAALLRRAAPPNLPHGVMVGFEPIAVGSETPYQVVESAVHGNYHRPQYVMAGSQQYEVAIEASHRVASSGGSVLLVVPTGRELETIAQRLRPLLGRRFVAVAPDASNREVTTAWSVAAVNAGVVVAGTHRIALWPVKSPRLAIVVEEGRRAMKDRQSPTLHAREVLQRRAAVQRFGLLYIGTLPSTNVVAAGVEILRRPGNARAWPPVEIVDRTQEPPGSGFLATPVRQAIRRAVELGRRVFVFTNRHGYAPAYRCVSCRTVRRCPACGSAVGTETTCERCGATLGGCTQCGDVHFEPLGAGEERIKEVLGSVFGRERVGPVGSDRSIWVGTERDVPFLIDVDVGVVLDADGLVLGTAYNAAEEGLRIMARLAGAIPFGDGRRLIVQTAQPAMAVLRALRSGDPLPFLRQELEERRKLLLPPAGDVLIVEVTPDSETAGSLLRSAMDDGVALLGPVVRKETARWLVQGRDLAETKQRLRAVVQSLRDAGCKVRVDVDPMDL